MNLKKMAAELWDTCTAIRNVTPVGHPNYQEMDRLVERIDHQAMALAELAGSDYNSICREFHVDGG